MDKSTRPEISAERIRAESNLRIRRALDRIQNAQNDLNSACAELSSLCGGITVWRASGKLADQVRALWYRVEAFRQKGRYRIDSVTIDAIIQREARS